MIKLRLILLNVYSRLFTTTLSFAISCLLIVIGYSSVAQTKVSNKIPDIEKFVKEQIDAGNIPGLSVLVIKNGTVILKKSYGWADVDQKKKVTNNTFFEIGSNSKAFTAMGILYLVQHGKIKLSAPVTAYLPWFKMQYDSKKSGLTTPVITVGELLHHTSGIPFSSIDQIKTDAGSNPLETTVRRLLNVRLAALPGDRFDYATLNYDILGLLIEKVSGQSYPAFIKQNILQPMALQQTFLSRQEAGAGLAKGYKLDFLRLKQYDAPFYTGNLPAGYIISNINDIEKWIWYQLGNGQDSISKKLIQDSHIPDRSVLPDPEGGSYAGGWVVYQNQKQTIAHSGNNPNYSSFISFRQREKTGVVVLANLNTTYSETIVKGILNILDGQQVNEQDSDVYKQLNAGMIVILIVSGILIISTCWFMGLMLIEWKQGKRKADIKITVKHIISLFLSLLTLCLIGFCIFITPKAMFGGLSWSFMEVWGPVSFLPCLLFLLGAISFFFLYYMCSSLLIMEGDRSLYTVVVLSTMAGLGNTLIILTINGAIGRHDIFSSGFFCFFLLGLVLYIYCQGQLRIKLLKVVNSFVYIIRINLIDNLLNTPFSKMEQLKHENLIAILSNDTEEVSNLPHVLVGIITGAVTLVCCLAYLGIENIWGLMISIVTIVTAASIYYYITKRASKVWDKARTMQNVYIGFINSLILGFKELKLNNKRNLEFEADLQKNSKDYRDSNINAGRMFVNVFIIGESIFTLVMGLVVFMFPLVLIGLTETKIRTFIFIFLYMAGPVNLLLNSFPQLTRIRISWRRIDQLKERVEALAVTDERQDLIIENGSMKTLELIEVEYKYNTDISEFSIGPVNYTFNSGEVVFITGGNGSGKSTLAKLICGLYPPSSGEVKLDGEQVDSRKLNELCTAIYSDYHLFEKLYGIDHHGQHDIIQERMGVLQLLGKTTVKNGEFSTIRLSTGQRKRIALLVSSLENKPICMFDEWAADQDPDFKSFFYNHLLPELKQQKKCVIVISHDNHYFYAADRMIKMESGELKVVDMESV
jgi:putative ATP-binding cassette transporter